MVSPTSSAIGSRAMADEVLTRRDGAVLTITFNRPEVYNAFNRELHAALHEARTRP